MGTKNNPGLFDCYTSALPDEEMFTLLARDPDYKEVVQFWMHKRIERIVIGEKPFSDISMIIEAQESIRRADEWYRLNYPRWRRE